MDILGDIKINEKTREKLDDILRIDQDYMLGLEETKKFISYLEKTNGSNYDFGFAYYMNALFNKFLNNIDIAISDLQKSNKYYNDEEDSEINKINNKWIEADMVYEFQNKNEQAIKLYTECYDFHKIRNKASSKQACAILLCNIGNLEHNELKIKKGLNLYKMLDDINPIEKQNVLKEMQKYLNSTFTYNKKLNRKIEA